MLNYVILSHLPLKEAKELLAMLRYRAGELVKDGEYSTASLIISSCEDLEAAIAKAGDEE